MRIVGLDLSLTATGVGIIQDAEISTHTIKSKGVKDASLLERRGRLAALRSEIGGFVMDADLVCVEQPAYSSTTGHMHDRSGLWWLVVEWMMGGLWSPAVVEIPPQAVKMYATGKGNAGKDDVLAAVIRRYADVEVSNNNESDGLVLAALGARHLGKQIDGEMPKASLRALEKIRWP